MANIVAAFRNAPSATTHYVYQYDYGARLYITGVKNLPNSLEVSFTKNPSRGKAIVRVGTKEDNVLIVDVPDVLLENNGVSINYYVFAFFYAENPDAKMGKTLYTVKIPVQSRQNPHTDKPVDEGAFAQAVKNIGELAAKADAAKKESEAWAHGGVADFPQCDGDNAKYWSDASKTYYDAVQSCTKTAEDAASRSARSASESSASADLADFNARAARQSASEAAVSAASTKANSKSAAASENAAKSYATAADASAQSATTSANNAIAAEKSAKDSATKANASQTAAEESENNAKASANDAKSAMSAALQAYNDAVTAKEGAESAATTASEHADTAKTYATQAQTALTSAEEARKSASASATAASTSATEAKKSEDAVKANAEQVAADKTAAASSRAAAAASAGESEQSKTQAQEYAQNAYNSAVGAESAKDDAEDARDEIRSMRAEAVTLLPGSDVTASYSDGLLSLGIPRGDKGETGATGPKGDTGEQGPKGDKGDPGEVSAEQLNTALATKADAIISSASGAIASFQDGAEAPVKSLTVGIEPVQEGTGDPSPDNVRPITGWTGVNVTRTGKNLFRLGVLAKTISVNGITVTPYNDVSVMVNGTNTAGDTAVQLDFDKWGSTPLSLKKQASDYKITYSFKIKGTISGTYDFYGGYIDKNGGAHQFGISPSTLVGTSTIPADAIGLRTWFNIGHGASASNAIIEIQAELGSTATDYEPYACQTYDITFPTGAGTVYGGELTVNEDGTGRLVVDRTIKKLNELAARSAALKNGVVFASVHNFANQSYFGASGFDYSKITCTIFQTKDRDAVWSGKIGISSWNHDLKMIIGGIPIQEATPQAVRAWLSSLGDDEIVVWPLLEPITYALTALEVLETLKGVNNVWADTGDMSVTYRADTKLYIDKKFTELQALILEN